MGKFVDEVEEGSAPQVFTCEILPAMNRQELAAVGFEDDTLQRAYDEQFGEGASLGYVRLESKVVDTRERMERRAFLFGAVTAQRHGR